MNQRAGGPAGRSEATGELTTVRDRVLTVPNALSVLRLVLVPVFLYLLLVAHTNGWAVAVLMFSGFSDWADGKIARLVPNR
jgi:cardiolipin synthase